MKINPDKMQIFLNTHTANIYNDRLRNVPSDPNQDFRNPNGSGRRPVMAHIKIINEDEATGTVAEDYQYLAASYSKMVQMDMPTPMVYRTSSVVPEYFRFGTLQNRVSTNDGAHDQEDDPELPGILVNFAVAMHSACFY
jgi:hypothetical protein